MNNLSIKITIAVLVLVGLFFWRWHFDGKPFSRATAEVCCRYSDGESQFYLYISGFDCVNSMPSGDVVDEERCLEQLWK